MAIITKIEAQKRSKDRVNIYVDDISKDGTYTLIIDVSYFLSSCSIFS